MKNPAEPTGWRDDLEDAGGLGEGSIHVVHLLGEQLRLVDSRVRRGLGRGAQVVRRLLVPVALLGMLVLSGLTLAPIYNGTLLPLLVAAAAAGSVLISVGVRRLPAWTAADRPIENTDVVLWYVFGIHHMTRPEDWPIMPSDIVSFWLKPFGFFDRNPTLDVPATTAGEHCHSGGDGHAASEGHPGGGHEH